MNDGLGRMLVKLVHLLRSEWLYLAFLGLPLSHFDSQLDFNFAFVGLFIIGVHIVAVEISRHLMKRGFG